MNPHYSAESVKLLAQMYDKVCCFMVIIFSAVLWRSYCLWYLFGPFTIRVF